MRTRGRGGVALWLLAVLPLAGCSFGDEAPSAGASSAAVSAAASRQPPVLRNGVSALEELTIAACPAGDGRLEASGDLRNYGTKTADYVVTVTWLDQDGATVDTAFTVIENVATRQKKGWQVTATLDQPAASCTTRVSRGNL